MTLEDHINRLLTGGGPAARTLDAPTDPVIATADLSRQPINVTTYTNPAPAPTPSRQVDNAPSSSGQNDPFATSIQVPGGSIATGPGSWQARNNGPFAGLSSAPTSPTAPASAPSYYTAPGVTASPYTDPNAYIDQTLAAFSKNGGTDSADYWKQKAAQWNDPGYLQQRIQYATGGPLAGQNPGGTSGGGSDFVDPTAQALEGLAQTLTHYFSTPPSNPQLDTYLSDLNAERQQAKQRAQTYADTLQSEVNQLKEPAYSPAQLATLRTQATDALEARRQATLKNAREAAYLKGFAPTSGTVKQAEDAVNRSFDQQRGAIESQLASNEINQGVSNQQLAVQLEGLIANALNGGDLTSVQSAADAARAEAAAQAANDQRQLEALQSAEVPYNMSQQGLSDLLASNGALGGATNPSDALQTIMALLGYGNQQQQISNQGTANTLAGIGILARLALG